MGLEIFQPELGRVVTEAIPAPWWMSGIRVKCSRCGGSGDMGVMSSSRCRVCRGKGYLKLDGEQTALYEWIEGYLDPDTEDEWLKEQLQKLMERRADILGKKG